MVYFHMDSQRCDAFFFIASLKKKFYNKSFNLSSVYSRLRPCKADMIVPNFHKSTGVKKYVINTQMKVNLVLKVASRRQSIFSFSAEVS